MNLTNGSSDDGYLDKLSIELAILQQDIILPEINTDPLTLSLLQELEEKGDYYKTPDSEYTNVIGAFYIPVLFPLVDNSESTELEFTAPSTKNIKNIKFRTKSYVERNFITLTIPKYIVLNFKDKIPSGTKFLVGFVGGDYSIEDINIIGIYGNSLTIGG